MPATRRSSAARIMPYTLRDLAPDDEAVAELSILVGFDDDLARRDHPHQEPSARTAHPDSPFARADPEPGPSSCPASYLNVTAHQRS